MKTSVLIIFAVTVLIVGALAVMNNVCKSGQHAWCAPKSTVRLLRGSHLSILLNEHFEEDGTLVFGAACQFGCEGVLFWRAYGALS